MDHKPAAMPQAPSPVTVPGPSLVPGVTGAKPNLFVAPTYEGATKLELEFFNELSRSWTISLVEYPSVAGRDPGPSAFEDLVAAAVRQIALAEPSEPLHLVGFSLGGHVMVEVAARMTAHGRKVAFVGVLFAIAFPGEADWRPATARQWLPRAAAPGGAANGKPSLNWPPTRAG
jgi:thioesterase domain-containing protein